MASPTSFSVTSKHASLRVAELSVSGIGSAGRKTGVGAGTGVGGASATGGAAGGTESSSGVPQAALRTFIALPNESTPSLSPACWMNVPSFVR